MASPDDPAQPHFLFVTSALHGRINPVRRLATSVAAANPGARVTFSTTVSRHRLMFPSLEYPDEEVVDAAGVLFAPYSDGHDDEGFDPGKHDVARASDVGREILSGVVSRLAAAARPVTRVVYTFIVGWAADVARAHAVPAAFYWIQPATVFAVYHRCFHGGDGEALLAASDELVRLPGLPAMKREALPSIVLATSPEHPMYMALQHFRRLFADIDAHRPTVLVNTFDALEPEALRAVPELELVAVGPAVDVPSTQPAGVNDGAKNKDEDDDDIIQWLDGHAARSVVYVSFGSLVPMSKNQEVEMQRGLEATGRPYLWARKGGAAASKDQDQDRKGMVVEWCEQTRVLSHGAVGCFVTHCGWNSALESVACGVPVVAVPQWTDQPTVAWLVAERASAGVRARVDRGGEEGVVGSDELRRCVEAVMGAGAADIRARMERWRELAREAIAAGGSSERNLRAFASGR